MLISTRVDVFFTWQPNAHRLLHRPTFMTRLAYRPTHAEFPHASLIHAICAYASIFSPLVRNPSPYANNRPLSKIFSSRQSVEGMLKQKAQVNCLPKGLIGENRYQRPLVICMPIIREKVEKRAFASASQCLTVSKV